MQGICYHVHLAWLMVVVMHLFAPLSHGHGVEQTICDDGDTCEGFTLRKKLIQSRKTLEVLKDQLDGTEETLVDASVGKPALCKRAREAIEKAETMQFRARIFFFYSRQNKQND
mmetsp:Transcript_11583/g.22411  ORF Transcript_11583/g.22411 Transcript_11583/m.22411 type:complete len:114 (+) Transcript_11583:87-428(+)